MKKIFPLFLFMCSCQSLTSKKEQLVKDIVDKDVNKQFYAIRDMGNSRDTFYIKYLMKDLDNQKTSYLWDFYGKTIYQVKLIALTQITGIESPVPVTYKADERNVDFWKSKYPNYFSAHINPSQSK